MKPLGLTMTGTTATQGTRPGNGRASQDQKGGLVAMTVTTDYTETRIQKRSLARSAGSQVPDRVWL